MPIITPAYPSMCATHNITMSTKEIISNEMKRAADIVDFIMLGQYQWKDLFSKHTFFTNGYKYYLSIIASSRSRDAQLIWSGLVESKIRLLVSSLEQVEAIHLAHPFNKGFDRVHHCHTEDEVEKIINGDLQFQAKDVQTEKADLTNPPKNVEISNDKEEKAEANTIYTTTYYIGIELEQGLAGCFLTIIIYVADLVAIDGTKQLDVSYQTREFKDICTAWQQYNPEMNTLNVVHTRK